MEKVYSCEDCKHFRQFDLSFGDIKVRICSLLKLNCEKIKGYKNFKNKNERK